MTFPLSRLMSAATASYGVYALVSPRHLGNALTTNPREQSAYDVLARTYGARDLTVSAVALLARAEDAVTAAMLVRIAFDVSDGLLLSTEARDATARTKVLGVTLGWAALNLAALLTDRRRTR
jgi:hypothetical protein